MDFITQRQQIIIQSFSPKNINVLIILFRGKHCLCGTVDNYCSLDLDVRIFRDDYCYTVLSDVNPIASGFKCEDGMILNEGKCIKEEKEGAEHEKICPNGYTLVNNGRCINYNKTTKKEKGLICDGENTKLKGNSCIIYEMIEANHS